MQLESPEPPTILIVDDQPTNLEVLYSILSQAGWTVRVEVRGTQALQQVRQNPPNLILLDVMLPDLDGFSVCQRLKDDPTTESIPIIFMTALADARDKVKGLSLGAVDYITKPFQQEEVLARVRLHLQLQQMTQLLHRQNADLQKLTQELEQRVEERTAELQESEECLRQLTENIASVFWLTNPEKSQMLYVSPAYEKIWGQSPTDLYRNPQSWLEAIHPEDRPQMVAALKLQALEQYDCQYRIIRPDGTVRWIRDRAFPIRDRVGQVYRLAGIAEDITEDRRIEETLRMQERAIAASSNGIVIADARLPDFPLIFVNAAFEKITGYCADEVLGRNCRFLQGEDVDQPELTVLRQALKAKQGCTVALRNYRKNGDLFWNELSIAPIYDDSGTLTHYIGIQTNISNRKQSELALEQSLQEKELLLKEIHHRVKNNLLIVSSLLELQADRLDDPKAIQGFEESQDRIHSMALVHEQLYGSKDLASINFGEYLEALVNHLCESFNASLRQIQVELHLAPIFLNVETVTPCGLITSELISNSFKHAFPHDSGGKIWVSIQQESDRQTVSLTIKDNGIGLPDTLNVHDTESLGMHLVSLLAKQLHGEIHYSPEEGATFQLVFKELQYQDRLRSDGSNH